MALDDLYKEIVLDHYQNPRNRGRLESPTVATRGHNPLCGDEIELALVIRDDCVADIAFSGRGCSISQASASMMTESVKGHRPDEAAAVAAGFRDMMMGSGGTEGINGNEELEALQGVKRYPVRVKCALLPWNALQEALDIYGRRRTE